MVSTTIWLVSKKSWLGKTSQTQDHHKLRFESHANQESFEKSTQIRLATLRNKTKI